MILNNENGGKDVFYNFQLWTDTTVFVTAQQYLTSDDRE